jgi:hypothetical protein
MGGQACVLYGAAEFSRDTDLALLSETGNLARLQDALDELQARCIAVPPFSAEYLRKGHAIHFRSHHPEAQGMRIDVMSVMRGVDPFQNCGLDEQLSTWKPANRLNCFRFPTWSKPKKHKETKIGR